MIRHCVFINFDPAVSETTIDDLMQDIADLRAHLPGIVAMQVGGNVSPEVGMDKGYSRGFTIDFDSPDSRDIYLADPAHQAAGARLVNAAVGGIDGIFVYDMEI